MLPYYVDNKHNLQTGLTKSIKEIQKLREINECIKGSNSEFGGIICTLKAVMKMA